MVKPFVGEGKWFERLLAVPDRDVSIETWRDGPFIPEPI
jgi:hypothetical protein